MGGGARPARARGGLGARARAGAPRGVAEPLLSRKLGAKPGAAVTVFFTTSRAELEARFGVLKETLAPPDGLWVAWPKKASKLETDLDFGAVQEIGLGAGL